MGKQYAYCPDGIVRYVEVRTENYPDEENPIVHFVHPSLLDKYKLIPESQNDKVQPLWMWDEDKQIFREPELYDIVDGQVYLGNMNVKQAIYNIGQDNARLINENAELKAATKTLESKNEALSQSSQFLEDCLAEMAGVVYA